MQLPDNVQNILAYGKGYKDGMKDGHICGFHDALVCTIHDLTALLKKYAELEKEYAGLQEKARRERMENMPQMEQPAEKKHGRWIKIEPIGTQFRRKCSECGGIVHAVSDFCPYCGARMDGGADNG